MTPVSTLTPHLCPGLPLRLSWPRAALGPLPGHGQPGCVSGQLPAGLSDWCPHSCLLSHQQHPGEDGGHHSHHGDEGDEQQGPGAAAEGPVGAGCRGGPGELCQTAPRQDAVLLPEGHPMAADDEDLWLPGQAGWRVQGQLAALARG